MDELIDQLVAQVGVNKEQASSAVSIILGFLKQSGPSDKVAELLGKMPGAESIETPSGGMGGMMGAMAAFGALQSAGLGMSEIQGVTRQLVAFAKQHAGDELVDEVVGSIPGLSQFA